MFDEKINWLVGHPIAKWVIIALTLAWAGAAIQMTSKVEALSEAEGFIDRDHELMKTFTLLEDEFPGAASGRTSGAAL